MKEEYILVSSLAMDLKRVALGLHKGSFKMAERFIQEAIRRQNELKKDTLPIYLMSLIEKSRKVLENRSERTAEDALMYATLFQNYALKKLKQQYI